MLYLEDYLEMIEHLPQELRDRFTEMRELDLSVQNNMDDLEKRVKILFNEWKRNPNDLPPTADLEFDVIKKEYCKTLEDQDEKVVLANQMYELVDRYLRRLDTELHKFKCELEADNKGITELLEKRSLELDTPMVNTTSSQKENRYERYTSSRTREKRRSDSCHQNSGGVTYPEKRPHLTHSLSLGEPRIAVGATNGNNVLLASQLQGIHGISQSQQLASMSSNTLSSSTNNSYYHSNSHQTSLIHSATNLLHPNLTNHSHSTTLSANSHATTNNTSSSSTTSSAQQSTTAHHNISTQVAAPTVNTSSMLLSANSVTSASAGNCNSSANSATSSGGGGGGYSLVSGGAGPAIAAAASQAIAATQKMQQGRRTPSLKASYEAINSSGSGGGLVKVNDMAIGRELAGAAQTAIQAIQHDSHKKRSTKKYSSSSSSTHHSSSSSSSHRHQLSGGSQSAAPSSGGGSHHSSLGGVASSQQAPMSLAALGAQQMELGVDADGGAYMEMGRAGAVDDGMAGAGGEDLAAGEYIDSYDPNEPRYCLCNQVSYGDMVACDNEDCPSEWFHYPCVGITAPPKGKWFCPQCTSSMRRRGTRKN